MSFANPLPWWALALIVAAAGLVAWLAYNRRTLSPSRRAVLVTLRFVTLLALVVFLLRPVARGTDADARDAIVAILVDTSRSMSIEDAGGRRIDRARRIVVERLLPALASQFHVEVLGFGDGVAPVRAGCSFPPRRGEATSRARSPAVRDRYRGRAVAGVVLVSDGGDTSGAGERAAEGGPPIYTVAVGSPTAGKDREILGVTAAEAILDDSRVDLAVSAVSHGLGNAPIELRLLENGRPIDVRRVTPAAEGSPVREVFQVSPGRGAPTVYTVETPVAAGELVPENNARSTLVQPPSRTRRVLLVEGAPGFEHSFLKRAWASDPGPRDRLGRAQGQERARRRHVLHPGRAVAERQPRCRIPFDARRAVPLRRGGARQRRSASVHQGPARSDAKLRRRARRRPARARRAVVPAPGTRRHCCSRTCFPSTSTLAAALARARACDGRRHGRRCRARLGGTRGESSVAHRRRAKRTP